MIDFEAVRLYRCDRCGMPKPKNRFRKNQPYWNMWCIRCEASPTGEFPIEETSEHVREDDESRD